MQRVSGVACDRCGCEQSAVIAEGRWWGQKVETRQCANCGNVAQVMAPADPAVKSVVKYVKVRCPFCQSRSVKTTSTRGAIRWHKCGDCQKPFQSIESD
jgi:DNA-directed RNA polymerase subunit RPC12/RpoP